MQAKIINKTTLSRKEIITAQYLNNRFLIIIYSFTLLLFLFIKLFSFFNEISQTQDILSILIVLISLFAIMFPFISGYRWYFKNKKKFGVTVQNVEYQFFDIYLKVINHSTNEENKIEYRRFRKRVETKKYISIVFDDNSYLIIDKNGFMKDNDYAKVDAYLKRFSL